MTCQNGLIQGRSHRRPDREDMSPVRSCGIQTRSKTGPKPKRIEPSTTGSSEPQIDNTAQDSGDNAGPAVVGKRTLPEVLGNLWDKAGRAGRLEVMREVTYDIISTI